jgi:hypothetical protein
VSPRFNSLEDVFLQLTEGACANESVDCQCSTHFQRLFECLREMGRDWLTLSLTVVFAVVRLSVLADHGWRPDSLCGR